MAGFMKQQKRRARCHLPITGLALIFHAFGYFMSELLLVKYVD